MLTLKQQVLRGSAMVSESRLMLDRLASQRQTLLQGLETSKQLLINRDPLYIARPVGMLFKRTNSNAPPLAAELAYLVQVANTPLHASLDKATLTLHTVSSLV